MLLLGFAVGVLAMGFAIRDTVFWSRWGLPRWPRQTMRYGCDVYGCRSSFTAQRGLALHERSAHPGSTPEERRQLWPHQLPVRCLDIVHRRRPRPELELLRSEVMVGGHRVVKR